MAKDSPSAVKQAMRYISVASVFLFIGFVAGATFQEAQFMRSCVASVRTIPHPGGDEPPYTEQERRDNYAWCEAEADYVFRHRPSPHKQDIFFGIGAKP
jgi:hypothetical protein